MNAIQVSNNGSVTLYSICKTEKTLIILGQVSAQSAHCALFKTHDNSNPVNKFHHDCLARLIEFRLWLILKSKLINI